MKTKQYKRKFAVFTIRAMPLADADWPAQKIKSARKRFARINKDM